jgi:hypothetical protein
LSLNAGSGAAIARPTFSRDFAGERTLNNGTGPAITFTRASNATYFDASGVLQTASNDTPRFDHDPATGASRGLLIEEARTNSIRNSQAGGATVGVIGSGGVMPTHWFVGTASGITREVIGTGTANGFAYVDVKLSGTNSSGSAVGFNIGYDGTTQVNAAAAQTWTSSVYVALTAGDLTGISTIRLSTIEYKADGTFLVSGNGSALSIAASMSRFAHTRTLTDALTERVWTGILVTVAGSATIDLTLRIAAPQLEQGAFATSYIPTTSAAATRAADFARVTPISSFYNQGEGTLFGEFSKFQMTANSKVAMFFDPINTARYGGLENDGGTPTTNRFIYQNNAGSTVASISFASAAANTVYRNCGGYASDNFQAAQNGTLGTADTSGTPADTLSHFGVGCLASTNGQFFLNGHIRKLAYWPRRLSNTLLQQLTT